MNTDTASQSHAPAARPGIDEARINQAFLEYDRACATYHPSLSEVFQAGYHAAIRDLDEQAILSALAAKAATYQGIPGLRFWLTSLDSLPDKPFVMASAYSKIDFKTSTESGDTFDEAVAKLRLHFKTPRQAAAELREKARKLFDDALALEARDGQQADQQIPAEAAVS